MGHVQFIAYPFYLIIVHIITEAAAFNQSVDATLSVSVGCWQRGMSLL